MVAGPACADHQSDKAVYGVLDFDIHMPPPETRGAVKHCPITRSGWSRIYRVRGKRWTAFLRARSQIQLKSMSRSVSANRTLATGKAALAPMSGLKSARLINPGRLLSARPGETFSEVAGR